MIFTSGSEQLPRQNGSRRKSSCKRVHFLIRKAGIRVTRPRAIPHKARLTALHAICVQIFRHIAQKSLAIRQYACGISRQSAEKSDNAPYAQALCGVALKQYCPYISCEVFLVGTGSETFLFLEKRRTKCDCRTGGMERCCGIWHIRY